MLIGAGLAITAGAGMGATASGSGAQSITVMIAASGPAETAAVEAAVAAWEEESGNTVELIPADDMNLQLGQALAGGDPPDVFYVNADKFQEYASGGSLAPVGDQLTDPDDFYPSLTSVFTYEDELYCPPEGLLDARPRDQHRHVDGGRAHRSRLPDDLGAARRGRRRR